MNGHISSASTLMGSQRSNIYQSLDQKIYFILETMSNLVKLFMRLKRRMWDRGREIGTREEEASTCTLGQIKELFGEKKKNET